MHHFFALAPGRFFMKSVIFQNPFEIHLRAYVHANENLDVLVDLNFGLARLLARPSALDFWGRRQMLQKYGLTENV